MAQSPAPARMYFTDLSVADIARALLVSGCGLALILAGPVLPW